MKVKYSKNQGDDFWQFFKVVPGVKILHSGYVKVSWGLKEYVSMLRMWFYGHLNGFLFHVYSIYTHSNVPQNA